MTEYTRVRVEFRLIGIINDPNGYREQSLLGSSVEFNVEEGAGGSHVLIPRYGGPGLSEGTSLVDAAARSVYNYWKERR